MNIIERRILQAIAIANIVFVPISASAYSIIFGAKDTGIRSDFNNAFDINIGSTVIDDGINFGAAPNTDTTNSFSSVTRSGNIGTDSLTYTIYDIDFSDPPNNGLITPGTAGNDIDDLDNIDVEKPAAQDSATGIYQWGVDSNTGNGTSNAALFDFTGNSIGHFGIDLHDFEAGAGISASNNTSGASGEIRLYQSGSLVYSYTLTFPGVDGGGSTDNPNNRIDNDSQRDGYGNQQSMFVGITANNPSEFFDQAVFVLGDDDVDTVGIPTSVNDGSTERWAADGFTFGYAYQTVPFDFYPSLGLLSVSGFWFLNKTIKARFNKSKI